MTRKIKPAAAIALLLAAMAGLIWLWFADPKAGSDKLGAAAWWSGSFPFCEHTQAEVLATGLDDVRGLACDPGGNVFLAEGNGSVLEYSSQGHLIQPEFTRQEPANIDQRGAAMAGNALLLAEHGRGRVSWWDQTAQLQRPLLAGAAFSGPAGIAAQGGVLFVSDDRPWPGIAEDQAYDSGDYGRWVDKGTQRLFGAVYACSLSTGQCDKVGSRLRHPSGIAAGGPAGPLYVAEADSNEVRWVIFQKKADDTWSQTGALGAVSTAGSAPPQFLGTALDQDARYLFAAGPDSLYVFALSEDRMVGRVEFEEPVTGVACHGRQVFAMVGHRLCRLTMDH